MKIWMGACGFAATVIVLAGGMSVGGQVAGKTAATLTVETGTVVSPVSPRLYGLMTEEINHAFQGGLDAEMVNNNTMRMSWDNVEEWRVVTRGNAQAEMKTEAKDGPSAALAGSLKVVATAASEGNEAGLSNLGFWGMAVRPYTVYRGSLYAKADEGVGPLTVQLIADNTGAALATAKVETYGSGWSRYEFTLKTREALASTTNHLEIVMAHPGTLRLQLVSLMPPTYRDRANGTRVDLMEKMAAMHPHFLRLPGGNYLEGDTLADWYDWKKTIGPLVDRPGHQAPWSYWSNDQFGLLEFLEWTEDLKIEPVLAVYAGYALRGEHVAVGKDLEPYVQSALDEVEYVTGDASTKWGAQRVKDGHPAAFPLHYIEIGNEDWFDKSGSYDARFAQFAVALRKKYPQYQLIATTTVKEKAGAEPDVIDDHYYKTSAEMFAMVHHYDNAPRNGPKIFVGEWATRSGSPTPNFGDALGDAALMTSMERNSDLIVMASYAPLLVNVNPGAMQWSTDLIGYDALKSYGSPSYYAQCMFGAHIGTSTVKSMIAGVGERFFYSATVSAKEHVLYLKLVNAMDKAQPLTISLPGMGAKAHVAKVTSLHGGSYMATNSITAPEVIRPVETTARFSGAAMQHTVPALTIEVVEIPTE